MELLKVTQEYRVDTEEEAKEALESFRKQADEKGYILKSAGYTLKEKKSKGEVIDRGYLVKVAEEFGTFWE